MTTGLGFLYDQNQQVAFHVYDIKKKTFFIKIIVY